jgi:glycosyltransferase involved in cell wall biosynthesis
MRSNPPRVSVGLPVYNGDRFLSEAIESLLAQTFHDYEIIISDNGSTDCTEEICRSYAERDDRIRYYRNKENRGATYNYVRVFKLSRGGYFKWATHDDLHAPQFLEKCVEVLDRDPSVCLCYPRAVKINDERQTVGTFSYGVDTQRPQLIWPQERLRAILWLNIGAPAIYGVIRSDVLRKTAGFGGTHAADQVLIAELALYGRLHEIPEALFIHREHSHRSVHENPSHHDMVVWANPATAGRITFPVWKVLGEYLSAIYRAPLSPLERLQCYPHLLRWTLYSRREMLDEIGLAAMRFISGPGKVRG